MASSDQSLDYLPMGYKFRPRDDELLGYYLLNKVRTARFMYDNVVPEADLYGTLEPWEIWNAFGGPQLEKGEKDLYFFTKLKRVSATDSRIARGIGSGTWLGENAGTPVRDPRTNQLLGSWKRFHYKNTKPKHQDGCWIMHEYSLAPCLVKKLKSSSSTTCSSSANDVDESQVLCRLRINIDKKGKMNDDDVGASSVLLQSQNKNQQIEKSQSESENCSAHQNSYLETQGTSTASDPATASLSQLDVYDILFNDQQMNHDLRNWTEQMDEDEVQKYFNNLSDSIL